MYVYGYIRSRVTFFCDIDEKLVNMTTVTYIDFLMKNSSICIIVTSPLPSLSFKGLTAKHLT